VLLALAGPDRTLHVPDSTQDGYGHLAAVTCTTTVPHSTAADVRVACSPNNPSGEVVSPEVVAHLCRRTRPARS